MLTNEQIVKNKYCTALLYKRVTDGSYEVWQDNKQYPEPNIIYGGYDAFTESKAWEFAAKIILNSIWIEYGKDIDKCFLTLFEDYGIKNNHSIIKNIPNFGIENLINEIIKADQICFETSLVDNSLELIINIMDLFLKLNIKNKNIFICGDLLFNLNNKYSINNSYKYKEIFNNNNICIMEPLEWCRIQYNNNTNKYEYTEFKKIKM